MSKRRFIIALLVVAVSVAIGLVPSILQFVAERELIKLKDRGIRVQVQGVSGFLIGVSATSAEVWVEIPVRSGAIRSFPLQVSVENASVSLRPRLNPLQTAAEFSAAAYSGSVGVTLTNLLASPRITANVEGLDIGLHPQLRALGIEQGALSVQVTEHPLGPVWESDATYALEIKDLSVLPSSSIQQISGVSRLEGGKASLKATIKKGGNLKIDSGSFDSSLASGTLLGSAVIDPKGDITNINGTIRVNLDRDGSSKLAAWLPILTNQTVSSEASSFVCSFRSATCGSSGTIKVGTTCLRSTCAG